MLEEMTQYHSHALANLATANQSDRTTVANMSKTIADLTQKQFPLHMDRTHRTTRPKIPLKIRGNSKRAHLEIFQRKAIDASQGTK